MSDAASFYGMVPSMHHMLIIQLIISYKLLTTGGIIVVRLWKYM